MTTMTVHAAPAAQAPGLMAQAKSWASLVRAYALRMGHNAIALVRQGRAIAAGWYTRLLAIIPQSVIVGGAAAWLMTKKGYHKTVDAGLWLVRKAGQALGFLGRLVHRGLLWAASRLVDVVGLVSEPAATRLEGRLATANCYTLRTARQAAYIGGVGIELTRTVLKSDIVTVATNIAAGAVLVGVLLGFAAPTLGASLAGIPIVSAFVGAGLAGSFAGLKMIGLVTAVASGVEIVTEVFRTSDRTDKVKGFVADVKAAGDPVVRPEEWTAEQEAQMAMATVVATPDAKLAEAGESVKAEADAAFREAKAIHNSGQNKSHKRR